MVFFVCLMQLCKSSVPHVVFLLLQPGVFSDISAVFFLLQLVEFYVLCEMV